MKQRGYRGNVSLRERISDEISRRRARDDMSRTKDDERRQRAQDLADTAANEMADGSASSIDQAARKRDLLEGPREFRAARVDRASKEAGD